MFGYFEHGQYIDSTPCDPISAKLDRHSMLLITCDFFCFPALFHMNNYVIPL